MIEQRSLIWMGTTAGRLGNSDAASGRQKDHGTLACWMVEAKSKSGDNRESVGDRMQNREVAERIQIARTMLPAAGFWKNHVGNRRLTRRLIGDRWRTIGAWNVDHVGARSPECDKRKRAKRARKGRQAGTEYP